MLIGLLLLPFCWAASAAVYQLYQTSVETAAAPHWESWALPIGFVLQIVIFFILPKAMRTYVLGHELTHALWAVMMGGRVGKMKVGKDGGHVELSKTNFVITLAPYFFPFYTFLVIAAYYLAGLAADMEPYRVWWLGAVGFTWSFHVAFTIHMLSERQPDIQEHGRVFSYVVIYTMNVLVMGLWVVLIGEPRFVTFGDLLKVESAIAYNFAWHHLMVSWAWITSVCQRTTRVGLL